MTARWRSGAEIAPHLAGAEFTSGVFTAAAQVTSFVHRGTYALRFNNQGHALYQLTAPLPTGAALRVYFLRTGTVLLNPTRILGLLSAGGHLASLTLRSDFKLELNLNVPETVLAVSSVTVPSDTWVCLELWVDTANKVVATRYNGAEWARAAVTFAAAGSVDRLFVGPEEAVPAGADMYYDDMALNSLEGPSNNGWPGPCEGGVLTFRPTGTGSVAGWTAIGAPTPHECVDDVIPDALTTYMQHVGSTPAGDAMALYFPVWPLAVPASCMMVGLVGTSGSPTSLLLTLYDPVLVQSAFVGVTLVSGWNPFYPAVTRDRAWDGTRRLLNNGYLMPAAGNPWRLLIIRNDSVAVAQGITTVWITVDFPLALAAAPVLPGRPYEATILATLNP